MLRYEVIRDLKMKFLQAVIENFSVVKKTSITDGRLVEIFLHMQIGLTKPLPRLPTQQGGGLEVT